MSFLTRLWNTVRNPVRYVGRDLEGNKFFEARSLNDSTITKRTVQYSDPEDVWKYIGGGKRLPIQWSAWLTHTRNHPPTLQELHADMARQQRVQANVALIEARDRAEAEERLRIRQQGAQEALDDASERLLPGPKTESTQAAAAEPASTTSPAKAKMSSAETRPVEIPVSSKPKETAEKIKVLPPTFLTPSTPRKTKTSTPFTLPSLQDLAEDTPAATATIREQQSSSSGGSAESLRKSSKDSSPSPWRSKPVPETESWQPKARSRG